VDIALVGCGRWGQHILRDLRALGCRVTVVARSRATAERASTGGAEHVVSTIGELNAVDGVVIATPTSTHVEVVDQTLTLGVPVFVEKPLCTDVADARRLASAAGDRLFVMDKWRYHPGVARIAKVAAQHELGDLRGLRTIRSGWGTPHADADTVWHLAPHDFAIALEILKAVPRPRHAAGHADGSKLVLLHGISFVGDIWHVIEVSERSPETIRRIELHCRDGVAVLAGGWDEHISIHRSDGTSEHVETPAELPLLAELRAFTAHVRGGPPPRSSAAEGAAIVEAIAQLRKLAGAA
jgi:predicted dehydrogenase